jgi:hypothetical protein
MANTLERGAYTNFAGADIVVMLNDVVFGELQAITYAVQREVAPLYGLGSANPRGFAKNKRGISGTMVFLVFDKDALLDAAKNTKMIPKGDFGYTAKANLLKKDRTPLGYSNYNNVYAPTAWNTTMNSFITGVREDGLVTVDQLFEPLNKDNIRYADQIPPFTVTISMGNEYGAAAGMAIYGVQIINEGSGVSIDDLVTEKAVTFVATDIKPLTPLSGSGRTAFNK